MPRLFLAVRPPEPILEALEHAIDRLKDCDADVRWVAREHLHMTLRFLGEVPDSSVPLVEELLAGACQSVPAQEAQVDLFSTQDRWPKPRVVHASVRGVSAESEAELQRLRGMLHEGAIRLGCPTDRDRFFGHITIGRVRSRGNPHFLRPFIAGGVMHLGNFRIDEVLLIQSRLSREGSVYTTLKTARLQA